MPRKVDKRKRRSDDESTKVNEGKNAKTPKKGELLTHVIS